MKTPVSEIMTRDVVTVRPDTTVEDAARILIESGFGCLPVTDEEGILVGIVSKTDLPGIEADRDPTPTVLHRPDHIVDLDRDPLMREPEG
jgi:CBS domain-containing protein